MHRDRAKRLVSHAEGKQTQGAYVVAVTDVQITDPCEIGKELQAAVIQIYRSPEVDNLYVGEIMEHVVDLDGSEVFQNTLSEMGQGGQGCTKRLDWRMISP